MVRFFETRVRVRLSETDALGIVYYAQYLVYFDIARLELLRSLGITGKGLKQRNLGFVAAEVSCKYHSSAKFDDVLKVKVRVARLGKSSVTYLQEVWRAGDREKIVSGRVVDVLVNSKGRPTAIPESLRSLLEGRRSPRPA